MKKVIFGISLAVLMVFGVASIQKAMAEKSSIEYTVFDKDPDGKKDGKKKSDSKDSKTTDKKTTTSKSTSSTSEKSSSCKERKNCCPGSTKSCGPKSGSPDKK